jgi:hypothetical protein
MEAEVPRREPVRPQPLEPWQKAYLDVLNQTIREKMIEIYKLPEWEQAPEFEKLFQFQQRGWNFVFGQ